MAREISERRLRNLLREYRKCKPRITHFQDSIYCDDVSRTFVGYFVQQEGIRKIGTFFFISTMVLKFFFSRVSNGKSTKFHFQEHKNASNSKTEIRDCRGGLLLRSPREKWCLPLSVFQISAFG